MKKQSNYAWLAVLFVFAMAAVPSVLPSVLHAKTTASITKATAQFNYSDGAQLEDIKKHFSRGCLDRPCVNGICQGIIGRSSDGLRCDCCAQKNGYCSTHSNQAPKRDQPIAK